MGVKLGLLPQGENKDLRMKSSVFWDVKGCSPVEIHQRFGGTYCLHLQCRRISQTRNQQRSGVTMEAVRSSQTSVDFYQTTRRYTPEDKNAHRQAVSPGERAPGIHWIGCWVGSRRGLDAGSRTSIVQLIAHRYTYRAIPAVMLYSPDTFSVVK
jgi:hypothetical protein